MGKRSSSPSCSSPCRPNKYKVVEYHCEDREVERRNMKTFAESYCDASLTRTSPQKRGRFQSSSPSRPFKYPRTESLAVGRWRSWISTCIKHVNPTGALKRSRSRSSSSHRSAKYFIVEEFPINGLVDRASWISSINNSDRKNSTCTLKRRRSPSSSSQYRSVKYSIVEYRNEDRKHWDIFDARSTRKSTQKRSRSQSCSPDRPFKYSKTESPVAVRRSGSSVFRSFINPTGGASKRSRHRSRSSSSHRPTKYFIVDGSRINGLVDRASRISSSDGENSTCRLKRSRSSSISSSCHPVKYRIIAYQNEDREYCDISICTANVVVRSTRKRSRSPSCSDQCHPVKCLKLDVDHNDIKDCRDYENSSAVDEYEQFFLFFSEEEDCRLDTVFCYCVLVYVYAMVCKHSSELIEFSVTQVFFFDTQ
jgi:hypothetical protein